MFAFLCQAEVGMTHESRKALWDLIAFYNKPGGTAGPRKLFFAFGIDMYPLQDFVLSSTDAQHSGRGHWGLYSWWASVHHMPKSLAGRACE